MALLIHQSGPVDGDDLVDSVGELISPILDMNTRVAMGHVLAVYVGYSRHF